MDDAAAVCQKDSSGVVFLFCKIASPDDIFAGYRVSVLDRSTYPSFDAGHCPCDGSCTGSGRPANKWKKSIAATRLLEFAMYRSVWLLTERKHATSQSRAGIGVAFSSSAKASQAFQ